MGAAKKLPLTVYVDKDLQELMSSFIQNRIKDLTAIEAAIRNNDFKEAQRLAHIVAGVAGGYGFNELGEYAKEIEKILENEAEAKNSKEKILSLVSELTVDMTMVNITYR